MLPDVPLNTILSLSSNPYRKLLRRRFPEPLLLFLVFLLGVWLWDNHLGSARNGTPDQISDLTWNLTMRQADRDLRLAEGTRDLPPLIQTLLGIEPLPLALQRHSEKLENLMRGYHNAGGQEQPSPTIYRGAYSLALLIALRADASPMAAPFSQVGLPRPPNREEIVERIQQADEYWWDLSYLRALPSARTGEAEKMVQGRTRRLVANTILARGIVLSLALGGVVFIPATILRFIRIRRQTGPVNYTHHWHLSFGLGVFLLAYLAFVGLGNTVNQGVMTLPSGGSLSMPVFTTLAIIVTLLPALIAIGLLFRKMSHAVSRFGLAGPVDWKIVLGCFAMLQILAFGLRMTLHTTHGPDSLRGLSPEESGSWGLVFGIVTACVAAPFAEEIVYRGILFRSLANRLSLPTAVALSSLLFALVHFYDGIGLLTVCLLGIACSLAYAGSRTLLTAVVLHALYNFAIKVPEWIVYQAPLS